MTERVRNYVKSKEPEWKVKYFGENKGDTVNNNYSVNMNVSGFNSDKLRKSYDNFDVDFPNYIDESPSDNVLINDCTDSSRYNQFINNVESREKIGYVEPPMVEQPTMTGITQTTLNNFHKKYPEISTVYPKDVRNLIQEQWRNIYCQEYYKNAHGELIHNPRIRDMVLDMSVVKGLPAFTTTIQNILNEYGVQTDVDGILGSKTVKALNSISNPNEFVDFAKERLKYYMPENGKFQKGWNNRIEQY